MILEISEEFVFFFVVKRLRSVLESFSELLGAVLGRLGAIWGSRGSLLEWRSNLVANLET